MNWKKKMSEEQPISRSEILAFTAEVVTAYIANNDISRSDLPGFIQTVFASLTGLSSDDAPEAELIPAVPVKKSITDNFIICLEDGKKLKMLKRHLMTAYGMTPDEYRAKWSLPGSYPMVAPNYSLKRQELAKKIGLGRKPEAVAAEPQAKAMRARVKVAA